MTMPTMIGMFNSRSLVMLSIMVALTWASQVTAFASVRTQSFVRSSEFALKAASAQGSYLSSLDTNAVVGPASASTTAQQPVPSAGTSQFLSSETLPLSVADEMASIAVETCKSKGFKPVSVCVLDNSGYVIVSKRCDGCSVRVGMKGNGSSHTTQLNVLLVLLACISILGTMGTFWCLFLTIGLVSYP